MADAAGDRPVQVQSACRLVTIFFSETPVTDYAGAQACDAELYGAWCRALLANGVYPPPSQFEAWFPSLAHTRGARGAHDRGGARRLRRPYDDARGRACAAARAAGRAPTGLPRRPRVRVRRAQRGATTAAGRGIHEGYQHHYGPAAPARDLALLDGDRRYAVGLARAGRASAT